MGLRVFVSAILTAILVSGCAGKKDAPASLSTGLKASDEMIATMLDTKMKQDFGEWKEPAVESVLSDIVHKIKPNSATRLVLLSSAAPFVVAGPGRRIYVTKGAVETAEFENEIVFPLASAVELIEANVPMKRYEAISGTRPVGAVFEGRLFDYEAYFDFGALAYQDADRKALARMHDRLYDHRGAVVLLRRWNTGPSAVALVKIWKIDPLPEERHRVVREEAGKIQPLRDPIIKGGAFEAMKTKLRKANARKSA